MLGGFDVFADPTVVFYPGENVRPRRASYHRAYNLNLNMNFPFAFLQMNEILIIAVVILILFGGSRIPALMRSLGRGAGEFQKGIDEGKKLMEKTKQDALREPDEDAPSPAEKRESVSE